MRTGPKGQKRPADVIGNAVRVMRIATGEERDDTPDDGKSAAAKELGVEGRKEARRQHDAATGAASEALENLEEIGAGRAG
ncbi:RNA-binding protein [Mesorhizobium sp. B1-1-8]|uniref:RNA-binding protein n=1 Tax=Mesorhizobium sp. B1-1-8 TaxID=2589976 RepID=UPI001D0068C0|nr:RNA-binding protein [Mesorhizobium sp. B1-1-8]UCI10361.1 RNA-binding protein [Mesorhizobium sp. B1-1-8]